MTHPRSYDVEQARQILAARSERRADGCLVWVRGKWPAGYGRFKIAGRRYAAHRVAWELANGMEVPEAACVCHRCDVHECIEPDHLFLGDHQDNMTDKMRKGRAPSLVGEMNGQAKLTYFDVVFILTCGLTKEVLAGGFGVATSTIHNILQRRKWRHVL